jgi:hypothetical protein
MMNDELKAEAFQFIIHHSAFIVQSLYEETPRTTE